MPRRLSLCELFPCESLRDFILGIGLRAAFPSSNGGDRRLSGVDVANWLALLAHSTLAITCKQHNQYVNIYMNALIVRNDGMNSS